LQPGVGAPDILLEVSGGDPGLSRVPVLFDGVRTLREVVRASAQPRLIVMQVAMVLKAFGLLQPVRAGEALPLVPDSAVSRDREIDRSGLRRGRPLCKRATIFKCSA
jgi:hypothetical protein